MQLSDDQIVKILIAKYKNSGKDLANILSDPVFLGLPIRSRLEALRNNAPELAAGVNPSFSKHDLKTTLTDMGVGAFSGALAAPAVIWGSKGKILSSPGLQTMLFGGLWGGLGGAVLGGASSLDNKGYRSDVRKGLDNIRKNPSEEEAVKTLSDVQRVRGVSIKNRLTNIFHGNYNAALRPNMEGFYGELNSQSAKINQLNEES